MEIYDNNKQSTIKAMSLYNKYQIFLFQYFTDLSAFIYMVQIADCKDFHQIVHNTQLYLTVIFYCHKTTAELMNIKAWQCISNCIVKPKQPFKIENSNQRFDQITLIFINSIITKTFK